MLELTFRHDNHVTKNTYRFKELGAKDTILEQREANIGTIYMKKDLFKGSVCPNEITVKVDW